MKTMPPTHTPTTGIETCWATHPRTPNKSMNARRRVLHWSRPIEDKKFDFPATYCGMLVVKKASSWEIGNRAPCFPCQKIKNQEAAVRAEQA